MKSYLHILTGLLLLGLLPLPVKAGAKLTKSEILEDSQKKIGQNFQITKKLKPRTSFWFDIYTKYGSHEHVIHHSEYPWIVFDVINTKAIMSGPEHRWTKYHKSQKLVSQRALEIKKTLKRLAKRKHYKNLKGLEKRLYRKLSWVRGKRSNVFNFASQKVRSQLGQKDFFLKGLANSTKYMSHIGEIFKRYKLPQELTRLPFVESSFNEAAQSKVGASGIWQLMPKTAQEHIRVTPHIDERNSPLKATQAAAKTLQQYYRNLKSWPLAVTAYNHGIGGVKRAIKVAHTRQLYRLINHKSKKLGFASKNFYTSFLAALYAEKYHNEIFRDETPKKESLYKLETVRLGEKIKTLNLIQQLGLDKEVLMSYNLDIKKAIKHNSYLPKGFKLYLPLKQGQALFKKATGALNIHRLSSY